MILVMYHGSRGLSLRQFGYRSYGHLTYDTIAATLIRIHTSKYLLVEFNSTHDRSVVNQFLRTHTSPSNHCKSSILKFLRLHIREVLCVSRLQSKRIKSDISRVVIIPQLPQGLAPISKVRFHPPNSRTTNLHSCDGRSKHDEWDSWHLLQLIIRWASDTEWTGELLSGKVSQTGNHRHATVHHLCFAVTLDLIQSNSSLGESEGIEVASGCDSAGETVAWEGFIWDPAVDGLDCHGCWLGNVSWDIGSGGFSSDYFFLCGSGEECRLGDRERVGGRKRGGGGDSGGEDGELHHGGVCCNVDFEEL
mmetsp:Transcript_1033/g.2288  ORF Transcript_1033/g.2288 Transcript_1033/m.2288 type:complete len:306 (+) Transcript_1033:44-961(+)